MKTYSVVWWNGGTERGSWHRTMPKSRDNAEIDLRDIQRMGYHAMLVDHEQSMRIGLPESPPSFTAR